MERTTSIEEHVTCSICMDLYNDPLALPCLHSFCRRCVQGLFSSSLVIKCPECRDEVKLGSKGIDSLPRNFQLAGIVDSYKRENEELREIRNRHRDDRPFCTQHRMTCQFMCTICKIQICLRCVVEKHSGHKVALTSNKKEDEDSSTNSLKCVEHNRGFKLYCCDCNKLTCLECIVRQHYAHSLSTIEEAYSYNLEILRGTLGELDARVRLLRATQKTCRTLAQKTQIDAQKKRQDLSMYFARLREALDRRENELKSELDHREQLIFQKYMSHSEGAMKKEKLVATTIDDVKRFSTESKLNFLHSYQSKVERVSLLLGEESADCPPQLKGLDDVTMMTCSLEKELTNVHWRWPKEEIKPLRKAPPIPATRKSLSGRREAATSNLGNYTLTVGAAVKRGKSWKGGMADGGPGHIGSVTQICLDANTYTVRWPNGKSDNYKYSPPDEEEICPP